jgi:hypothetical protein
LLDRLGFQAVERKKGPQRGTEEGQPVAFETLTFRLP